MMLFKDIFDELKELNETELFYKQYYIAKQNPQNFRKYLISLDQKIIYENKWWIPELQDSFSRYFPESYIEHSRDNIKIVRHNRYNPLFPHSHAFFEMIYVYEGRCENTIEGKLINMEQGDICIVAPETTHTMGVFDDDSIVFNIIIRKSTFIDKFIDLFNDDTILSVFFNETLFSNKANSYITFSAKNDKYLQSILKFLIVEGIRLEKYYNTSMEILLRAAFCVMLRKSNEMMISNTHSIYTPKVIEILKYIQANFKSVTLDVLADEFNYTPDYISKLIKRHTGLSFTYILQDIKFKKAAKMLRSSNIKIIDVCYAIGYNSVEYFSRKFKDIFGISPMEYRKTHIEN